MACIFIDAGGVGDLGGVGHVVEETVVLEATDGGDGRGEVNVKFGRDFVGDVGTGAGEGTIFGEA